MSGKILLMKNVKTSHISSVTNEGEPAISEVIQGDGNVGGISAVFDSPSAGSVADYISEIVLDGDIGEAASKTSIDNGANYKGRETLGIADTANNQATVLTAASSGAASSNPVAMDTTGDGFPDKVFGLIQDRQDASSRIALYSTTNLSGTPTWSLETTIIDNTVATADLPAVNPGLIAIEQRLIAYWAELTDIKCAYSDDYGATWSNPSVCAISGTSSAPYFDVKVLNSGIVGLVYRKLSDNDLRIVYATSISGLTFTDISFTTNAGVDRQQPSLCERHNGDLWCFYVNTASGVAGRYSEDGGETWVGDPNPLPTTSGMRRPSSVCLPNDQMIVHMDNTVPGWACYRYIRSHIGDWENTFTVSASPGVDTSAYARSEMILGTLWLMLTATSAGVTTITSQTLLDVVVFVQDPTIGSITFNDAGSAQDDLTVDATNLRYHEVGWIHLDIDITTAAGTDIFRWRINEGNWTTGVECTTEYIELGNTGLKVKFGAITGHVVGDDWSVIITPGDWDWTSEDWLHLPDGSTKVFYRHEGGGGAKADSFTTSAAPRYPKERAILGDINHPLRSTGDNAVFRLNFDFGANGRYPFNAFAAFGHFKAIQCHADPTDPLITPDFTNTLTLTKETLVGVTGELGSIYSSGASMTPHKYADGKHWLYSSTGGEAFTIWDNDEERIYVEGTSMVPYNGDTFLVISDRAWASFATQIYRFITFEIDAHHTSKNRYELLLFFGMALDLARESKKPTLSQAVSMRETPAGGVVTNKIGEPRLDYQLTIHRIGKTGSSLYEKTKALLIHNDTSATPLVYIPDDTISTDCRIMIARNQVQFNHGRTVINFRELI